MNLKKRVIKCLHCFGSFESYISSKRKFCSKKCANIFNWKRREKSGGKKFKCLECTKEFFVRESHVKFREKRCRKIKFCSKECSFAKSRNKRFKCKVCKNLFKPKRNAQKFCSLNCVTVWRKGQKKTGSWYENGYVVIYDGEGKGIKEHIKIVEEKLGRKLYLDEVVHHVNGKKNDNRIENLRLMKRGEHSKLHREIEKRKGKKFFVSKQ